MIAEDTLLEIDKSYKDVKELIENVKYKSALRAINKLYTQAIDLNYTKGINLYYEYYISILYNTHENQNALPYLYHLINIYKKTNNTEKLGGLYTILGSILSRLSDYRSAAYYLDIALNINESGDPINLTSLIETYIQLSSNSWNEGDYDLSTIYIDKGLELLKGESKNAKNDDSFLYLLIFKIKILFKKKNLLLARKIYDSIVKSRPTFNKKDRTYLNEIELMILFITKDFEGDYFVNLAENTLKASIEINDKSLKTRILNGLKEYYHIKGEMALAYQYADQLLKMKAEEKFKQKDSFDNIEANKKLKISKKHNNEFELYLKSELDIAAKYQANFFSSAHTSKKMKVDVIFRPNRSLSGDYIGIFNLSNEDNHYLYVLADVVGKGITASYISFMLEGIIKSIIYNTDSFSLKSIVKNINTILSDTLSNQGFVSLWAGMLDINNKTIESVNAGHLPTYLLTKTKGIVELNKGTTILGMFEDLPHLESEKTTFEEGCSIIAYSDGITESMNENMEMYEDDFKVLVTNYAKNRNQNFLEELEKDLKTYQAEKQMQDDISCLLVEFKS